MNDQAAVDGSSSSTTTPPSSSSESAPPAPVYVPLPDEGKTCKTTLDGSTTEFESYYTKEFKWTNK